MQNLKRIFSQALSALALSLIAACGGGSGSATATANGVVQVSAGSPIGSAKVIFTSLSDSTTYSASADSSGNISIPKTGLSYPAIVQATSLDGSLTYYGYIANSAQQTAPVNPITSLILAMASGLNPSAITSTSQLTDAIMTTAKGNAGAIFANIFSAYNVASTVDLLSSNFTQDHTGLDLLLDTISMQIDSLGNSVLCSKINGSCKTVTASSPNTTAIAYSAQDATALAGAPLAKCFTTISGFSLNSLTSNATLYSASFLNGGQSAAQYMSSMATTYSGLSVNFNTPLYVGKDGNGNYLFKFSIVNASTNAFITNTSMPFNLDAGGNCVLVGNQLPFAVSVSSLVLNQSRVDGTSNPNAVTNGVVTGLLFQAGGSSLISTFYQGVQVKTLSFDYCDLSANCTHLVDMQKGASNNGFYFANNPVPILSYSSAGLTSASFYNGNPNPVKVTFKDAGGSQIGSALYLKVNGRFISDTELSAITVPSITNATALLGTTTDIASPAISYATSAGFVVTSATLTHGAYTGQTTGTSQMILSPLSGNATIADTISATTDTYRSLVLNSNIPGGGIMRTKYVWSPLCTGCV